MNRHYSSSRIVKWMREKVFHVNKPTSLPWGAWGVWEADLKKEKPVAHFFTETFPDWVQWVPDTFVDPIYNLKYEITNWKNGSHRLDSNLMKGAYHSFENRLLHSAFDSYVDFIEQEEANMEIVFASQKKCQCAKCQEENEK